MGQPEIAALTEQLQKGDASGVGLYMSGLFTEDRLDTLQLIREQNQKNREAAPSVPALQIRARTGAHDGRTYEEIDLLPGGLSNLMGGSRSIRAAWTSRILLVAMQTDPEARKHCPKAVTR